MQFTKITIGKSSAKQTDPRSQYVVQLIPCFQ